MIATFLRRPGQRPPRHPPQSLQPHPLTVRLPPESQADLTPTSPAPTTAESQLGKREDPAHDVWKTNKKGNKYKVGCNCGVDVELYLATVSGLKKGDPWCAAFVNWVLKQNHMTGTASGLAMSFAKWQQSLDKPAYGCIGVIEHTMDDGTIDHHVTIIVGVNKFGDLIGLGGNQGDKVKYSAYPRSWFKAFRYPAGQQPNYNLPLRSEMTKTEGTK